MNKKRIAIILAVVVVLSAGVVLMSGKQIKNPGQKKTGTGQNTQQSETLVPEKVDYSGLGNIAGNTENGGDQTWVGENKILINTIVNEESKMFFFDTESQKISMACGKPDCLHNDATCTAKIVLWYMQSYGSVYFGVPPLNRQEIWKIQGEDVSCFYKCDEDIGGLWGYNGYMYYTTDTGLYRISIEDTSERVQVLERPVWQLFLTFHEDRMYFCEEDELLYVADLDGKNKKCVLKEKLCTPQIYQDRIYYRSLEYDKNGKWEIKNTLCSVSLDGGDKEQVLDEVYQFCIADNGIYYIDIPDESKDQETAIHFLDLGTGVQKKITECAVGIYVFEGTDWIVMERTDGELEKGEEASKPTHLYCVKKDGTQCRRLEYPEVVEN